MLKNFSIKLEKETEYMYDFLNKFVLENQENFIKLSKIKPKTINYGFFLRDFCEKKNEIEVKIEYWEVFNEDKFEVKKFKFVLIKDQDNNFKYKRGSFSIKE